MSLRSSAARRFAIERSSSAIHVSLQSLGAAGGVNRTGVEVVVRVLLALVVRVLLVELRVFVVALVTSLVHLRVTDGRVARHDELVLLRRLLEVNWS